MRHTVFAPVVAGLLSLAVRVQAADPLPPPTVEVASAPSSNKLVADFGLNVNTLGPSFAAFAGFQHDPVRVGALLDLGATWYDWVTFSGVAVGPVLELPYQFRTSLIGGVGWQTYHFEDCNEACKAARVDESRIAYEGRLGIGRSFPVGRRRTTQIVVMAWFAANYSSRREAALTASDIQYSNEPTSSGGFRPGGLVSVGLDWPL